MKALFKLFFVIIMTGLFAGCSSNDMEILFPRKQLDRCSMVPEFHRKLLETGQNYRIKLTDSQREKFFLSIKGRIRIDIEREFILRGDLKPDVWVQSGGSDNSVEFVRFIKDDVYASYSSVCMTYHSDGRFISSGAGGRIFPSKESSSEELRP